jgi:hypothetical protein
MDNAYNNACDGTIIYNLIPTLEMHTKSYAFMHACHPPKTHTHTYIRMLFLTPLTTQTNTTFKYVQLAGGCQN